MIEENEDAFQSHSDRGSYWNRGTRNQCLRRLCQRTSRSTQNGCLREPNCLSARTLCPPAWNTAGAQLRNRCGVFQRRKTGDAVFICTMDQQHEQQTMEALRLGYHVFLEKPIAVTEEGSRRVVREAIRCQRVLNIGLVLRYSPLFATVKEIIDAGTLGDLVSVRSSENMGTWVFAHSFVRGNWGNIARELAYDHSKGMPRFRYFMLAGRFSAGTPFLHDFSARAIERADAAGGAAALHRRLSACRHVSVRSGSILPRRHTHDA